MTARNNGLVPLLDGNASPRRITWWAAYKLLYKSALHLLPASLLSSRYDGRTKG